MAHFLERLRWASQVFKNNPSAPLCARQACDAIVRQIDTLRTKFVFKVRMGFEQPDFFLKASIVCKSIFIKCDEASKRYFSVPGAKDESPSGRGTTGMSKCSMPSDIDRARVYFANIRPAKATRYLYGPYDRFVDEYWFLCHDGSAIIQSAPPGGPQYMRGYVRDNKCTS